jgi:cardiolipin synthase
MTTRRVPRRYRAAKERYVQGNRVALLRDGREAFPAMLDAIESAERQVLLEMYWFDSDRVGRRFAEALGKAAARGVEVAVIYDALGSIEADDTMFQELRAAGVHVVEFNPVLPWRRHFKLEKMSRRDHRKILVIDEQIGFTGGINLNDHWLPEEEGGDGWRDDMVLLEGPAVMGLVDTFRRTWSREDGPRLRMLPQSSTRAAAGGLNVRVLGENAFRHRRQIVTAYLYRIYGAKQRVWLSNSYFMPDRRVVRALKRAADRGVDVRILLPGISDVELVRYAGRAVWGGLLRHGVKIYEWQRSVLHAKTAVIDGVWSTVGTFNLDYRSLLSNLEINVAVLDEAFGEVMERAFERDLAESLEVDAQAFFFRPLSERLLEYGLYQFRKLL